MKTPTILLANHCVCKFHAPHYWARQRQHSLVSNLVWWGVLWRKLLLEEDVLPAYSQHNQTQDLWLSAGPIYSLCMPAPPFWFFKGVGHTCTHVSFLLLPLVYVKRKDSLLCPTSSIPCTHHLTCRQMKPFKYLFIMSSVPIRPCNSCHAPHVSLKHNVINTSSALMDASHTNALMKCVIVFPHRTLTIYLTLRPEAPQSCWKPLAIKWTLSSASVTLSSSLSLKRHSCEKKIQASEGFGAQLQLP